MRSGAKVAVIGGVFVLVVGGVGYGAYNVLDGLGGGGGDAADGRPASAVVKTGPPSKAEISETSKKFLDAWAAA